MALQELERKLAESFDCLRQENKSLIDLLKQRQHLLKSSLGQETSTTLQEETHDNHPLLKNVNSKKTVGFGALEKDNDTERKTIISSEQPPLVTEGHQQVARHRLAQCTSQTGTSLPREHNTVNGSHITAPILPEGDESPTTKSILRRRKIIDENVHVTSRYHHTPTGTPKLNRKSGLNFSYSDNDSNASADLCVERNDHDINEDIAILEASKQQRTHEKEAKDLERQLARRLLDDPGNDRQNASIVKTISQRPKNVVFDVNAREPLDETLNSMNSSKTSAKSSFMSRMQTLHTDTHSTRPLLGYDWIAGVLENEGLVAERDGLFKEVEEFRRANREECVGSSTTWDNSLDLRRPISPEIQDPGHTCIHSFSVNDRLFTESVNLNEEGKSVCPVCLISRKAPTKEDPAFVRVSIPRSTLESPYKIIPNKRKNFDPSDSYALSKHCLAGWQNAKPSMLPTASTLDLKDKVIPKDITTYDEARKVAESFSRMGRLLNGKELPEDQLAKELLNRTHCLRYELEIMKESLNQPGVQESY